MTQNPIVYEVNLTIAASRVAQFDAWLREHVDQMLGLPGFVDATIFDAATPDDDSHTRSRCVHYQLEDRAALERYFDEHAARMRADGVERFGADMTASRRILSHHSGTERCANCQALLAGQYCGECGQRHRTRMISLWELLRDVFEDALSWDSRVWRSLRPLLLSPGKLTSEYLDGRRMYYTPPLRMYLVLSISFFLLSSLPALEDFNAASMLQLNPTADDFEVRFGPDSVSDVEGSSEQASAAATPDDGTDSEEKDSDEEVINCDWTNLDVSLPSVSEAVVQARLRQICLSIIDDQGRSFLNRFTDLLPNLLIVMLPFTALAGKFIYPLSRRYYVEHLLFYTHYHSFVFLLLIIAMGVTAVTARIGGLSWLSDLFSTAVFLYAIYYLYRALRQVFLQGRWTTLFKMFLISMSYMIGASILALVGVAITALSL